MKVGRRELALGVFFLFISAAVFLARVDEPRIDGATREHAAKSLAHAMAGPSSASPNASSRRIAGRVTAEGKPVPLAAVQLEPLHTATVRSAQVLTNSDGSFDFGEYPLFQYAVTASVATGAPASLQIDLRNPLQAPPSDKLELQIHGCDATLSGTVADAEGGPIPGARLRTSASAWNPTDNDGHYRLCVRPLVPTEVVVEADGYGSIRSTTIAQGRTVKDFVLVPAGFVVGRVVSADTTAAIQNADVLVFSLTRGADGAAQGRAVSDDMGRFRIPMTPGEYAVSAWTDHIGMTEPSSVSVAAGKLSNEIVLRLTRHARVHGQLMTEGRPVVGAEISAVATASGLRLGEACSDADGRFSLDVLRGEIAFVSKAYDVISPTKFDVDSDEATADVELKAKSALHGTVRREAVAVSGAQVSVDGLETTSDVDGRFSIGGLTSGKHLVTACSEKFGACSAQQEIDLGRSEDQALDLDLSASASIAGVLVDQTGAPVPGALVEFSFNDDVGYSISDADGRFRCGQMMGGGEYRPTVRRSMGSSQLLKPVGGQFNRTFLRDKQSHVDSLRLSVIIERGSIWGDVRDATGQPVADATIRAVLVKSGAGASSFVAAPVITKMDGTFAIHGLLSGEYRLLAIAPEGETASTAPTRTGSRVTIRLSARGLVEGTLSHFTSTPEVTAQPLDSPSRRLRVTVENSAFRIQLPPGDYRFMATNAKEGDSALVSVQAGLSSQVVLESHGQGQVEGVVLDHASQHPVPGLRCRAVMAVDGLPAIASWTAEQATTTDDLGRFNVDPVPAGNVIVACFGSQAISSASALVVVPRSDKAAIVLEAVQRATGEDGDIGVTIQNWTTPLTVASVAPGGPAAARGIVPGDRIVDVDGYSTAHLDTSGLLMLIRNHPPGSEVEMTIVHPDGSTERVTVVAEHQLQ